MSLHYAALSPNGSHKPPSSFGCGNLSRTVDLFIRGAGDGWENVWLRAGTTPNGPVTIILLMWSTESANKYYSVQMGRRI